MLLCVLVYIFNLTYPNRHEHLMFFDRLAISDIIKKVRIFFRKNKKVNIEKLYFSSTSKSMTYHWFWTCRFKKWLYNYARDNTSVQFVLIEKSGFHKKNFWILGNKNIKFYYYFGNSYTAQKRRWFQYVWARQTHVSEFIFWEFWAQMILMYCP